jgi:Mycobacterium membrane protein
MTDSSRRDGTDPTQPLGPSYPGYTDPAYAGQAPYGPTYQPPAAPKPTEELPAYSPYGYDPYATSQYGAPYPPGEPPQQPPSPEGPKAPRWLWVVAAVAVVAVIGLVIALVIVNSSRQQTVVAPLPTPTEPNFTTPRTTAPPTTTSPTPTIPVLPLPTVPTTPPTDTTSPGATETVVYDVSGDGRAINITYVDTGGVLQTEFNVVLPWSKQVEVPKGTASVSIVNVGREVTCSITIDGVAEQQQTGAGLTICTAAG